MRRSLAEDLHDAARRRFDAGVPVQRFDGASNRIEAGHCKRSRNQVEQAAARGRGATSSACENGSVDAQASERPSAAFALEHANSALEVGRILGRSKVPLFRPRR